MARELGASALSRSVRSAQHPTYDGHAPARTSHGALAARMVAALHFARDSHPAPHRAPVGGCAGTEAVSPLRVAFSGSQGAGTHQEETLGVRMTAALHNVSSTAATAPARPTLLLACFTSRSCGRRGSTVVEIAGTHAVSTMP